MKVKGEISDQKKKKKILLSRKRETGLLSTESNSYSSYVSVI